MQLHPLAARQNGSDWVVGRVETGEFVEMPEDGHRALGLLKLGLTVGEVRTRLLHDSDRELDVADFVRALSELGFVAEIDETSVRDCPPPTATLPRLTPGHVAWTLSPLTAVAVATIVLAGIGVLATGAAPLPSYHDLLWDKQGALVILGDAALGWIMLILHEGGHLCTARAAGAPARVRVSTRLQFLVVQTDVSGIWAAPRRTRCTVYLAGIAVNLVIASAALVVGTLIQPGVVSSMLAAATVISLLQIAAQLLLFMRTDLYFLLQDLAGAPNLYADSCAYLRHKVTVLRRPLHSTPRADPTKTLRPGHRRIVLAYAPLLVVGTGCCLAFAATVTLPATAAILERATHVLRTASTTENLLGAVSTLALMGTIQLLWVAAWWRRHGHRVHFRRRSHLSDPNAVEGGDPA